MVGAADGVKMKMVQITAMINQIPYMQNMEKTHVGMQFDHVPAYGAGVDRSREWA